MNLSDHINTGMSLEQTFLVEEEHLAKHIGSGSVRVLATPWMIAFMERVSHQLLANHLPDSYSSVGYIVDIQHIAPTPLGSRVRVRANVAEISGLQVSFEVMAWDENEQIGRGRHLRVVIQPERFLIRVASKTDPEQDELTRGKSVTK
jgi:fluoroacetyl-CoA thioesterase